MAMEGGGSPFAASWGSSRMRGVAADGRIETFGRKGLRGAGGDKGQATTASITNPGGLAFDANGSLYVADLSNYRVRRIARDGIITTVAGGDAPGFSGDGGPAFEARLSFPRGVAVDASGRLYVADTGNSRVRRVDRAGNIATVAGNGGFFKTPGREPRRGAGFFPSPGGGVALGGPRFWGGRAH